LKDKITGTKFALPALYQPMSLIPLEIWKASPSSTNGNEQSHRNVNRDGVNLTLLAGIMRGMQYDARAMSALSLYSSHGIYHRDQISTHFRRAQRSVNRHGARFLSKFYVKVVISGSGLVQRRVAERGAPDETTMSPGNTIDDITMLGASSTIAAGETSNHRNTARQLQAEIPLYTTRPLASFPRAEELNGTPNLPDSRLGHFDYLPLFNHGLEFHPVQDLHHDFGYMESWDLSTPVVHPTESLYTAAPFMYHDFPTPGAPMFDMAFDGEVQDQSNSTYPLADIDPNTRRW
jgi:hypothetical protein